MFQTGTQKAAYCCPKVSSYQVTTIIITTLFFTEHFKHDADDEQVFGLTREILYLRESPIYFRSFCSTGCVTAYYLITSSLNSKLRLFYRPLSLRVVLYAITGLFLYGVHSFAQDFAQVSILMRQNYETNKVPFFRFQSMVIQMRS